MNKETNELEFKTHKTQEKGQIILNFTRPRDRLILYRKKKLLLSLSLGCVPVYGQCQAGVDNGFEAPLPKAGWI